MSGIYIHIPFCKQACSYCDFYFLTRGELRQPFVEALVKEIESYAGTRYCRETIHTIYLGGGTPSLLNRLQLSKIFEALEQTFDLQPVEVTMELNPDDVTAGYLEMIQEIGVNRASMGVQSFREEILTFMHRAHTPAEALSALEALQKANFPTFTADLIYGNPGQTLNMLSKDIQRLLEFDPPHISAYSLTVEPRTRLGKQVELGRIDPPADDEVSAHFDLVSNQLESAGIKQYEVSNFAKEGKEAVHNSNYWNHENYIGLGPSAHSFWWDEEGAERWRNKPDLKYYLKNSSTRIKDNSETLSLKILAEERIMLGLRTVRGVSLETLKNTYQYTFNEDQLRWLDYQGNKGMVIKDEDRIKMSPEGLKISDLLLVDLLSKETST
ncbi:MAG: radical SAM family heme chaperone HemW, partial [Balneolaceae bacterium]